MCRQAGTICIPYLNTSAILLSPAGSLFDTMAPKDKLCLRGKKQICLGNRKTPECTSPSCCGSTVLLSCDLGLLLLHLSASFWAWWALGCSLAEFLANIALCDFTRTSDLL